MNVMFQEDVDMAHCLSNMTYSLKVENMRYRKSASDLGSASHRAELRSSRLRSYLSSRNVFTKASRSVRLWG
jgi:hypothetical protein